MFLRKLHSHIQKNEIGFLSYKYNSKCIKDLHMRAKTLKNSWKPLSHFICQLFPGCDPNSTKDKIGLQQSYKLLCLKGGCWQSN
jgi:hypothetical protein